MKAPDKIYLHPDIGDREFIRPWCVRAVTTDAVCYINKDLLLEWAKEKKAELLDDEELTDVAAGINMGMDMLIHKINSL